MSTQRNNVFHIQISAIYLELKVQFLHNTFTRNSAHFKEKYYLTMFSIFNVFINFSLKTTTTQIGCLL